MYTWVAAKLKVKIVHRYMERGHTQNEADNIHQVIEKATKPRDVNHPDQWYDIIQKAKVQREAYIVVKLKEHIYDFHELAEVHQRWTQPNVQWKRVIEVVVDPANPQTVHIKYDWTSPAIAVNVIQRSKVGRPINLGGYTLPKPPPGPLRLKKPKQQDFKTMVKDNLVPSEFHSWYKTFYEGEPATSAETEDAVEIEILEEMVDLDEGE